jgi:hypothetical protein
MRRVVLLLLLGAASACGSGSKYQPPADAAVYEVDYDLPPGCPPEPNNKGIGKPCTRGGGQCGNSLRCTCDPFLGVQLTGLPCVCTQVQLAPTGSTNPCGPPLASDYCGDNATCCNYANSAAYCVPDICLPGGQCLVFVTPDAGTN